nr:ABC transporter ATP-binding protein [uncultured Pedobacter sp.]
MLKALNIVKNYGELQILKNVSLEVAKGEIVSIVGASGAGKSTLLHIIGTLDKPDGGQVFINDADTTKLGAKALSAFRNKNIGFIFQFHHLLPEFTALENVCIPAFIAKKSKAEAESKALELLTLLGLKDRAHHKPAAMSGGEQQRVAVARALINQPDLILADEPSGNLDSHHAKELHQLFFDLRDRFNHTFIIVTHNEELADMADRKIVMKDGLIYNN